MKRFLILFAALLIMMPAAISARDTNKNNVVKEQRTMLENLLRQQPTSRGELAKYCTRQFLASGQPMSLMDNSPGLYGNYGMIDVEVKAIKSEGNNTFRVTFYSEECADYTIVYKLKKEAGRWKIDSMQIGR